MYIYIYIYVYIYIYMCIYIYIHIHTNICICIYIHIYICICIYIHTHICVSFYCQVSLIKDSYVCRDLFHKSLIFSRIFFFLATCKKRFPATFFHTVYMWFQKVGRSILKKCLIYKDFFSKATRKSRAMCFPPHFSMWRESL